MPLPIRTFAAAALSLLALCGPCRAEGVAADLVQTYLTKGPISQADEKLVALAAGTTGSADAQLGLGLIRSARAFEHLAQSLYKYGFISKARELSGMAGIEPGSVAANPNPEPITYEQFRGILQAFINDLQASDDALAAVGDKPAKLKVDLSVVRFDWNGDGKIGPEDQFGAAIADHDDNGNPKPFIVGFDTADAKWLRGYDNLLMATAKAWLAHDFSESWDAGFGLIFPKAKASMAQADGGSPDSPTLFEVPKRQADGIADFITLIHTIRWPVTDKAMWGEVRQHLKKVIALNRETWALVRAETDDDHEWLPGPQQKSGVLSGLPVTQERIDAWLGLMTQLDAVLDGKLLVPHWRFVKGVNLAKVFDQPKSFDLVLWITGPAALPYLEDGPTMSDSDWGQASRIFEGNLWTYAFYFN